MPPETGVEARVLDGKLVPEPREGEVVVFYIRFAHGFRFPASDFYRCFLDFFRLQLHHLGANLVLQLAAFTACCEGYLGMLPYTKLWCRLFYPKQ